MELDLTSLGNAVRRLREGLSRCERESADEQIRDGLIQRFEFTYELSHNMVRRYLREVAPSPDEVERMAFADLIRTANAQVCCAMAGQLGDAFAKCGPAPVTPTTHAWRKKSLQRSQAFWKKPSTFTPSCSAGLHDAIFLN